MSSMPMTRLLRFALLIDAAASAATGLLLVGGHAMLSPLLGLPEALLLGAGLVSLPYALGLLVLSRRQRIPAALGWAVVGFNTLWALESVGILVLGWVQPSAWGLAFVVAQAAAGVLWAAGPFALTRIGVGHLNVTWAIAVLPWALPRLCRPSDDGARRWSSSLTSHSWNPCRRWITRRTSRTATSFGLSCASMKSQDPGRRSS